MVDVLAGVGASVNRGLRCRGGKTVLPSTKQILNTSGLKEQLEVQVLLNIPGRKTVARKSPAVISFQQSLENLNYRDLQDQSHSCWSKHQMFLKHFSPVALLTEQRTAVLSHYMLLLEKAVLSEDLLI